MPDLMKTVHRPNRRRWSAEVLRTHLEADNGDCSSCSTASCRVSWPCLPVRAAMVYLGRPPARLPRAAGTVAVASSRAVPGDVRPPS